VKKDTIRLLITLDCNLSCSYCCNKQQRVYSQFQKKTFSEIDFSKYQNVCITGGEPFLKKDLLYQIIDDIPEGKNVYLYTNGVLITDEDVVRLRSLEKAGRIKGINIGFHEGQNEFLLELEKRHPTGHIPLRFLRLQFERKAWERYQRIEGLSWIHDSLYLKHPRSFKFLTLNDCDRPNEDWVQLQAVPAVRRIAREVT